MTLALVDHALTDPSPLRTRVCVVVVGEDPTGLAAALDSVCAQRVRPDLVLLASSSMAGAPPPDLGPDLEVRALPVGTPALRPAVEAAARSLDGDWLLWVLTDGCTAGSQVLGDLVEAHRRSPSVGVVAPKLVDASDGSRLRSVGIRATRSGRIIDDPADGAPDQGQFDDRHDVLAVPLAGALVESSLVTALGGWEPTFGDVAADLDFGWRAQRLGRRVLVLPRTTVRADAGVGLATATTPARRRAGRRVALARATWWGAPLLALWLLLSTVVGAVALALVKRPRAAAAALGDVLALDPVRVPGAWWRTRGKAPVRRADLGGLFVSGEDVRRRLADQVHEALLPGRGGSGEGPSDGGRSTAMRVLTHPGLLVTVLVAALCAAAGRRLGAGLLTGIGGGVVGGELSGGPVTSAALWHAWTDAWRGAGLGGPGAGGPHLALLAAPTWLVEHLPGLSGVASPGGLVVGLVLVLGPPLATASAYAAARVLTLARWPRAAAALVWAVAGAAPSAYAEGRLGAVVAHVLLPAVGAGLVLLARADGTATAAWATALAAGVLGAFAPATLVLTAALALVVIVGASSAGARRRALAPLLVAPALLGPWLLAVRDDPRLLVAGPGLTSWGAAEHSLVDLATLLPSGTGDLGVWAVVPVMVLAVLALVGLVTDRRPRSLPSGLAAAAVLSSAAVLVTPRVHLAQPVSELDGTTTTLVTPWVGLPMLAAELVLLALALVAVTSGVPARWRARAGRLPEVGQALLVGVGIMAGAVLVLQTFGAGLGAWVDPRPAVAVDHADGDVAGRTLYVRTTPEGASFQVLGRELTDVARSLPVTTSSNALLEPVVSDLLSGHDAAAGGLARFAVDVIGVDEAADPVLVRSLDATEGLTRLVARDGWNYWRVAAVGAESDRPVAPARLELRRGTHGEVVPTTGQHAATTTTLTTEPGDLLVVAEPEGWARHATVSWQGQQVPVTVTDAVPTYVLSGGSGELVVRVEDEHEPLRRAQLVLGAVVLFLAVPFGSRASRRRR